MRVSTKFSYDLLVKENPFQNKFLKGLQKDAEYVGLTQSVLRRQYYYLGQALLEEKDTISAKATVDYVTNMFPARTITNGVYAFSLGKLYYRMGEKELGQSVVKSSINSYINKIEQYMSVTPKRPLIHRYHLDQFFNNLKGMINQLQSYDAPLYKIYNNQFQTIYKRFKGYCIINQLNTG